MEMSAQQLTQMLGNLASRRAEATSSSIAGASIAVTPGADSRYARMTIALPNGQTFTVQVEEI